MRGPAKIWGRARGASSVDDVAPTLDTDGFPLQGVTACIVTVTIGTGTLASGGQILCYRQTDGAGAPWTRWEVYDLLLSGGAKSESSPELRIEVGSGRLYFERVGVTGSTTLEVAYQTQARRTA